MVARRVASVAIALACSFTASCRGQVSLGDREDSAPPPVQRLVCPAAPAEPVTLADADVSLGGIRSIAAHGGVVYVLFERGTAAQLVLARIGSAGAISDVAAAGAGASSIAAAAEGAYVAADRELFRVPVTGALTSVRAENPIGAVVTGSGRVYWAIASTGQIFGWDFGVGAPSLLGTAAGAPITGLAFARGVLHASGVRVTAIDAAGGAPRDVTDRCGPGAVASSDDGIVCAVNGTIVRVRRDGGSIVVPDQPGALDVLGAAGRAFWYRGSGASGVIMNLPFDGIGGPTILVSGLVESGPIATDGCALYFASGRKILRRGL